MKKKIKLVIIIAITVLGFVNLNIGNVKNNNISSLKFANIEALAYMPPPIACSESISSSGEGNLTHVTYCGDCDAHLARSWSDNTFCLP